MKMKICGIKTFDDALMVIEAGVDIIGFNFYTQSPRYISPGDCMRLVVRLETALREEMSRVTMMGVFVNSERDNMHAIFRDCHLDMIQLSGDEPPEVLEQLGERAFKVLRPTSFAEFDRRGRALPAPDHGACLDDRHLPPRGVRRHRPDGGLGPGAPDCPDQPPILLAGGLNPDNVADAIRQRQSLGGGCGLGGRVCAGRERSAKSARLYPGGALCRQGTFAMIGSPAQTPAQTGSQAGCRRSLAPTAASLSPRRSCPPWSSWKRPTGPRRSTLAFQAELADLLHTYVGRPTPLTYARRLSADLGGAQIYLKREDLAHSGAHKINNALGQALLARRMGKRRIIAETGAGQHGVATATAAACSGWNAWSTWARWISPASSPMCCACACWAPRCARWRAAAAR